jgi:hypothetical protein
MISLATECAHGPTSGSTSSIALGKRPRSTDTSVEPRSRSWGTEASPQSTPAPLLTGSPVAASAPAPDSPPNPPAREIQAAVVGSWSGLLIWQRGGSEVHTRVQATDLIRDPYVYFLLDLASWRIHVYAGGYRCGRRPCDLKSSRPGYPRSTFKPGSERTRPRLRRSNAPMRRRITPTLKSWSSR